MRAILYLKQILLTHPHLKKYHFPICAKRVELAWGLRAGGPGPRLGSSGARQHRSSLREGAASHQEKNACIYLAITICYTSVGVSEASEPQYSKAPCPCRQLISGPEPLLELLASALH